MKKYAVVLTMAATICGCNMLPSGNPPEGNIVNNDFTKKEKNYTVHQAVDYLINSFTIAAMTYCPGMEIEIASKGDHTADNWAAMIIRQSGKITGNKLTGSKSPWVIDSQIDANMITMNLYHNGNKVWTESVTIKLNQ